MLKPGQLVLFNNHPHRVQHVNTSRAYIVPLKKYKRKHAAAPRGISIGANSVLPLLTEESAAEALTAPPVSDISGPAPRLRLPGWVAKDAPDYRSGSLNERVLNYILMYPGQRTPQIEAAFKQEAMGNIKACLRRLYVAGVIAKE